MTNIQTVTSPVFSSFKGWQSTQIKILIKMMPRFRHIQEHPTGGANTAFDNGSYWLAGGFTPLEDIC